MRRGYHQIMTILAMVVAGCSQTSSGPVDNSNADDGFDTSRPMNELMHHVIDYTAEGIWKWEGWVTDANGTRPLFPSNDDEWEQAESAAQSVAELMNLLMLPDRKMNDPRWEQAVITVRNSALSIAEAARAQDQEQFFETGSQLDDACESCHLAFIAPPAEAGATK